MTLKLIIAPTFEPITLIEAKEQCNVDADLTEDDNLLMSIITAAREQAEHLSNRALISQTWERVLDRFPCGYGQRGQQIELKAMPLSLVSLKYIDGAGAQQTLDPSAYVLNTDEPPGHVYPALGTTWPTTHVDAVGAVRVRFTCGYGDATAVPQAVKAWMKLRIGTLYKFREQIAAGVSLAELPGGFTDRLLDRAVVWP
jgi:uncharacterized phiE125 gp8 family phage protein